MYSENLCIQGIKAEFGDAIFTLYKITASENMPSDKMKQHAMYHSHFYYECHIFVDKCDKYMTQSDTVTVNKGMMLIIPPHTEHFPFNREDSESRIVLGMTLEQSDKESGEFQYFFNTLFEIVNKPIPLPETLMEVIRNFNSSFQSSELRSTCIRKAAAYGIIAQLFDSVNQFHFSSTQKQLVNADDTADITLEWMINDIRYSLQDIADSLGYSVRHTSRLIRHKYGKSLVEIRQRNMISTAKKLLNSTPSLSMESIAIQSGFSCRDALTAAFRRWENMTSTEYKKGTDNK